MSERKACQTVNQPRSTQRYQALIPDDEPALIKAMLDLVRQHPRFGYRRIWVMLKRKGWQINKKRVHRLWRREGLRVPETKRKKRAVGSGDNACHVRRAERKNHVWCWDFIFDTTDNGTTLKWLSVVDEYTRECLALKVDRSITSEDVIDTLVMLFAMRGVPAHIRSDNGPEFIANAIKKWLNQIDVKTLYVEPASPWQNGYAESFHSKVRDEFLNCEIFESLCSAQKQTGRWKNEYNQVRPHSSLGYRTPEEFSQQCGPGRRTESDWKDHTAELTRLS